MYRFETMHEVYIFVYMPRYSLEAVPGFFKIQIVTGEKKWNGTYYFSLTVYCWE